MNTVLRFFLFALCAIGALAGAAVFACLTYGFLSSGIPHYVFLAWVPLALSVGATVTGFGLVHTS